MRMKKLAVTTLVLALSAGSAMTSFAARWQNKDGGWKYYWDDHNYAQNCWIQHKNNWYYVGNDGNRRTGWLHLNDKWYFIADSGQMLAGLLKINGNVYYMDGSGGHLRTGPIEVRGQIYNFGEYGVTNGAPYVYEEWNSNGTPKTAAPIRSY